MSNSLDNDYTYTLMTDKQTGGRCNILPGGATLSCQVGL